MTREEEFRAYLVEQVKAMGQEMIDRAEDIVGNGDVLHSLNITIDFPIPFEEIPVLKVSKEYYSKRYLELLEQRSNSKAEKMKQLRKNTARMREENNHD